MILGINGQNHDSSLALIDGEEIVWAAHAERYSRVKNDNRLNLEMVKEMYEYGSPKSIVWFENPLTKSLRKLYSGQRPWWCDPKEELARVGLGHLPVEHVQHHHSHAAAGFYTSNFSDASILVVDAIGEWNTVSIWKATDHCELEKVWSKNYPNSIGLFYTAMTQYLGLKPNEEEYILMGMAAFGKPVLSEYFKRQFFKKFEGPDFKLRHNLHQGCLWWNNMSGASKFDIAASVQAVMEEYLLKTAQWIKQNLPSKNLIFMGGCALNCVANSIIAKKAGFENMWVMPNPGDAGSAIGAVAAVEQRPLYWNGPFLGTNIDRPLDIENIVNDLTKGKVVAVANGRAEFGPRALGNRSLLCDPRGKDAKLRMNHLKKREEFRPFAPAILEEHADTYFDMPVKSSPYMQFVARCRLPDDFPGICHIDNTSRVQTVNHADNKNFRAILELWYEKTGCPMLMNTSLNIKGEPLVNSLEDAVRWEQINGVKVY
jgi:carbamoyltransferase